MHISGSESSGSLPESEIRGADQPGQDFIAEGETHIVWEDRWQRLSRSS